VTGRRSAGHQKKLELEAERIDKEVHSDTCDDLVKGKPDNWGYTPLRATQIIIKEMCGTCLWFTWCSWTGRRMVPTEKLEKEWKEREED
jgi:hypothetical protein